MQAAYVGEINDKRLWSRIKTRSCSVADYCMLNQYLKRLAFRVASYTSRLISQGRKGLTTISLMWTASPVRWYPSNTVAFLAL